MVMVLASEAHPSWSSGPVSFELKKKMVLDEMRWSVVFGGFVTDEFLICFVSLYPCKALKNGFFLNAEKPAENRTL